MCFKLKQTFWGVYNFIQKKVNALPQGLLEARKLFLSTSIEESIARKAPWNQALTSLNDPPNNSFL